MTECNADGAIGFILNQLSNLKVKDVIPDLAGADFPLFIGGPVEVDTVHFIHRCYDRLNSGEQVVDDIYWGGDFETLKILIDNDSISADEVKFFIGYSGWSATQLVEEIKENTWIVADQYHQETLFSSNEEELWKEVIINLGPKYAHVSNFPTNPSLN